MSYYKYYRLIQIDIFNSKINLDRDNHQIMKLVKKFDSRENFLLYIFMNFE